MILQDASIVALARAEVETMRGEPHRQDAVSTWDRLLNEDVERIAQTLSADDVEGDFVRETMPCFFMFKESTMTELVTRSRQVFKAERVGG